LRSTDSLWAAGVCAREDGAREAALGALPRVVDEAADAEAVTIPETEVCEASKLSPGSFSEGEAFWGVFIARLAAAPSASLVPLLRRQSVGGDGARRGADGYCFVERRRD